MTGFDFSDSPKKLRDIIYGGTGLATVVILEPLRSVSVLQANVSARDSLLSGSKRFIRSLNKPCKVSWIRKSFSINDFVNSFIKI